MSSGPATSIRSEQPGDEPAIRALNDVAFGGPVEGGIVDAIRGTADWIDGGSMVAVRPDAPGLIVGHVLLSLGRLIGDDGSQRPIWMVGPVAVSPDLQRHGIGGALMRAAIQLATDRDQPLLVLLGHADYYPRFGFEPARSIGILPPNPAWSDPHWMALRLPAWAPDLRGTAQFAPAFPLD
jgi:putative acetyltransferase